MTVERPATPAPYGPAVALVVVDMQNAFVDPDGALHVEGAARVLAAVNGEIERAMLAGSPILTTRDVDPDPSQDAAARPREWSTALHPRLRSTGTTIEKGPGAEEGFSGFWRRPMPGSEPGPSGLEAALREHGVRHVVVVGLAADVCVSATALDARRLGFEVTVPLGATAFVHAHPRGDEASIAELRDTGIIVFDAN